ncbi:hypothetical protein BJV77DRAFT_1158512 [Russula vinacea]|nr:hypothetical protein BJV77DRAFT_1158512 [Russula vinacea]
MLPYTQQTYRQYPSTPIRSSGPGSPSRSRASHSMAPGFPQRVATSYDAQSYTTDVYRNQPPVPTGLAYGNDGLGGSEYDLNYAMTGYWGTQASQALHNSDYLMPSYPNNILYSNFGQGETNYAGYPYHFGAYQVPSPTSFSTHLPGANPDQGTSSEWRFQTCWVSHEEQDEIHLTIALKKT